eukprot:527630_1
MDSEIELHASIDDPPQFNPELQNLDTHCQELEEERHSKLAFTNLFTLIIVIILIAGKLIHNITIYQIISFTLTCIIIGFDVHCLIAIFSFDHLHFIRIKRRRAPNATHIFIPYSFEEQENIPMSSISLMTGLRGSNVEGVLTYCLTLTFGLIFTAVCIKWIETNTFERKDIGLLLLLISAYGTLLVSAWNLEENVESKISNIMHYITAMMYVVIAPLSLCIYQNWSNLSIIIISITYVGLFCWVCIMEIIQRKKNMDRSSVHRYSLIILMVELVATTCVYSASILFVYSM